MVRAADPPPRIVVELQQDVRPGETQIHVPIGDAAHLVVTVPPQARAGDELVFDQEINGEWACSVVRRSSGLSAATGAVAASRSLRIPIGHPADDRAVWPGESVSLNVGDGELVSLKVPNVASPGDMLELEADPRGTWTCRLVRGLAGLVAEGQMATVPKALVKEDPAERRRRAELLKPLREPLDGEAEVVAQAVFQGVVAAARTAGAHVSSKLRRGASPVLSSAFGILAAEAVDVGEELVRIPASLHLSIRTCQRLLPDVTGALLAMTDDLKGRADENAFAVCVAKLLREEWLRERGHPDVKVQDASVSLEADTASVAVTELWKQYSRALLAERFDEHPYWCCVKDLSTIREHLQPSEEVNYLAMMVGDAFATYDAIVEGVDARLLDWGFDPAIFLQARLCVQSRVFHLQGVSSLVPVVDFCNHSPHPGLRWRFEDGAVGGTGGVMILEAIRPHGVGEELFISYGRRSNPLLFRTYGFTLPSSLEPAWTYVAHVCQDANQTGGVDFRRHLPDRLRSLVVVLEAPNLHPTLAEALNGCAENGCDSAVAYLRELCSSKLAAYEQDSSLQPALRALGIARRDGGSATWWNAIAAPAMGGDLAPDAKASSLLDHALRVKMSEYLCLLAHFEVVDGCKGAAEVAKDVLSGGLGAHASTLRESLRYAFSLLQAGKRIAVGCAESGLRG